MSDTTKPAILPPADLDDLRDRYITRRIPDFCMEGAPGDVRALLGHIDALTAELAEAHTRAVAPCRVDPFNSRACERGTKGCEARHWEPRARGEGSPT